MADVDGTGKIYIDAKTWFDFLFVQAGGAIPRGAEIAFSLPKNDEEGVVVDYAYSTICHPQDWATPPDFLKKEPK